MAFYEEQNPRDISIPQILPLINKFLPNTNKNDVKFLYHGTYNVFEVKKEFIFRIPDKSLRNEKGIQIIEREVKTLKLLNLNLVIPIPEPIFINLEKKIPLMGYKKIQGISLSKYTQKFDNPCFIKIARSIGDFLSQLHAKKLIGEYSTHIGFDYPDFLTYYKEIWEKEYRETKSIVWPLISSSQKKWIQVLYDNFLSKIEDFSFAPTIIHGDFDTSNILVDIACCKLSGIIDFEETRIFDPAIDFLFFREEFLFQSEIMNSYNGIIDKDFHERMQFSFSRACIPYILYGVRNNIPSLTKAGLELLSERMTMFP